jgi:hypothetical protein
VTNLTRHDLRHNFVSMLHAAGVADSIIMSMTGHKTTATLHRYSHTNDQMKRDALAAFPQPTRRGEVVTRGREMSSSSRVQVVPRAGIEPATRGFSVLQNHFLRCPSITHHRVSRGHTRNASTS